MTTLSNQQRSQVKQAWENVVSNFQQNTRTVPTGGNLTTDINCYEIPNTTPYGVGLSKHKKDGWQYKTSIRSTPSVDRWG
jgi:hypothetical protein